MTTLRPTVLLLITTFDMGGAERVYVQLALGLSQRGYRVIAACLQARSGLVGRELEDAGIEVNNLGMSSKFDIPALFRLVKLIRGNSVDVVYTFLIHSHLLGRFAARLAHVPVLLSSQQTMLYENRFVEWANRLTSRWCDKVVAVSRNVEDYLAANVGIPRAKLVTIYNSVDTDRLSHVTPRQSRETDKGPIVGCCARLTPEKDHSGLIKAIQIVKREFPAICLRLAGDGPERGRLEGLVESDGLRHTVQFLGHVGDVAKFYSTLDLYVQPSYVEGLPCAVLEALACGLPAVVTRVGGNEEIVRDGEAGRVVPPRSPEALATAIRWMLAHPDAARAMGEHGRRTVRERFSTEAMVTATDGLIGKLLRTKQLQGAQA